MDLLRTSYINCGKSYSRSFNNYSTEVTGQKTSDSYLILCAHIQYNLRKLYLEDMFYLDFICLSLHISHVSTTGIVLITNTHQYDSVESALLLLVMFE